MPKTEDNTVKTTKKKALKQIATTLEIALAPMQQVLNEKQFKNRIKKASKVLATGFPTKKGLPLELAKSKIVLSTELSGVTTVQ
jgi:hypothetical protein